MTDHREIQELIALNDLSTEERIRVERHLEGCEECRRVAESLSISREDLRAMQEIEPPGQLKSVFLKRVASDRVGRKKRSPLTFWQTPVGVIASSIFLLFILLYLYVHIFRGTPDTEPTILIQVLPAGRVVQTYHPAADLVRRSRGTILTLHLILSPDGAVEALLSMDGGSDELREAYRELLPGWRFEVPHGGDVVVILTIPKPLQE